MRDYSRQTDLVPMDRLQDTQITIVGVGAVGRNVAVQLASTGARKIDLIDFDSVEEPNVTTQGYWRSQIGKFKVDATVEAMQQIDGELNPVPIPTRWNSKMRLRGAVFCCVDNMESRKLIFEGVQKTADFWVDGRMLGFTAYCYPYAKKDFDKYLETWFPQDEAEPGRCTSSSTIFSASFLASAMIYSYVRWLNDKSVYPFGGLPCEFCKL